MQTLRLSFISLRFDYTHLFVITNLGYKEVVVHSPWLAKANEPAPHR